MTFRFPDMFQRGIPSPWPQSVMGVWSRNGRIKRRISVFRQPALYHSVKVQLWNQKDGHIESISLTDEDAATLGRWLIELSEQHQRTASARRDAIT